MGYNSHQNEKRRCCFLSCRLLLGVCRYVASFIDQANPQHISHIHNRKGVLAKVPEPSHIWNFNGDATDAIGGIVGVPQGRAKYANNSVEGSQSLQLVFNSSVVVNSRHLKQSFTDYTVSLWFYAQKTGGYRYLYEEGGAWTGLALRLKGKKHIQAAVKEQGSNVKAVSATSTIQTDTWHHVVAVYSNGTLSITLDGGSWQEIETGFGELGQHGNAASFGGGGLNQWDAVPRFVGFIDNVQIWDGAALTKAEITELYEQVQTPQPTQPPTKEPDPRPNILLLVADDMNYDSPGFMGGVAPDVTPHLDQLAKESLVYTRAHAATSVCQPSRQAMLSGFYPPNYGSVGFLPMAQGTPTVVTRLHDDGYLTASFHKVYHMRPYSSFPWDMTEKNTDLPSHQNKEGSNGKKSIGYAPTVLGEATRATIEAAKNAGKPFFLVINSADPHRPFHSDDMTVENRTKQLEFPSRVYREEEVTIPKPLPDIPGVRKDVSQYASNVRRLDDTVGRCLKELQDSGLSNNTIVLFLSDNGMPLPFGKFDTYRDSLHGPLVIRWPGRIAPGVDPEHLVSLIDIAPTIIDAVEADPLPNIDGRSLLPLIDDEPGVVWRDVVVGTRYEDFINTNYFKDNPERRQKFLDQGWTENPNGAMRKEQNRRGITDGTYHYIFNHFFNASDPEDASSQSISYRAMEEAALFDDEIAARVEMYRFRPQDEFYHIVEDPGSQINLIHNVTYEEPIARLRQKLLTWMETTNDPVYADYEAFLQDTIS